MERPILFNTLMVTAILEGRKTQTRRIVKHPLGFEQVNTVNGPSWRYREFRKINGTIYETGSGPLDESIDFIKSLCPLGQVGDFLWVRETFRLFDSDECPHSDFPCGCPRNGTPLFKASHDCGDGEKWTPSIHMPRSASRILLEITNIRVEQLNQISRVDAVKEGLHQLPATGRYVVNKGDQYFGGASSNPCEVFKWLWESINGSDSWAQNPWVWVVEFKVKEPQQ
ncbi:hypothetical protein HUN33_12175 [Acinetobacter bereziniae]|uniref:hypothetical protein n=1 Tax=Acinetobacter bereziniae TaxID=106648 RepID=UPI00157FE290|nr:hypothetical protein [Acinetobacter bereziniae]NUF61568.1 hypothetical protein [Acinetobacter bereziniae]NUG08901.1 hypothetical protein [Acinetobacter bereziniae]NUG62329.1 hypothetical protein [Acinetobacter bereziniae]NUG70589.1 hypothetical protein [Acinetobacter bereziniae]NUG80805.1 hypothetical protein [Acinetobacter bereziniae]